MLVDEVVQVPEKLKGVLDSIVELVGVVDDALADGWQADQDITTIMMGAVQTLGAQMANLKAAKDEALETPAEAVMGSVVFGKKVYDKLA